MLRRGTTIVCAALAGCAFDSGSFKSFGSDGAVPEDPDAQVIDAPPGTPDAQPIPDVARPPDAMPPLGPFGPPVLVPGLNTYDNEDDPTLTGDMLEIYFDSDRAGGLGGGDIWRATRLTVFDSWETAEPVTIVNTSSTETTPEISSDGLTLHFASTRPGGAGGLDVYVATRASRLVEFDQPERASELCTGDNDFGATPSPGGVLLYMASTRPGVGGNDIYRTTRALPMGAWNAPSLVPGLNTIGVDSDQWVDASDTILYYATDRPGGEGGRDVWVTERPSPAEAYGEPTPVPELNGASMDMDPWLSPDLRTVIFCSDRLGDEDLFIATR